MAHRTARGNSPLTTVDSISATSGDWPAVSIVIPTYNRKHQLAETLQCALRQSYPAERVEVILVDNSSDDGTEEWYRSLRGESERNLRYIRKEPAGPGPARNLGAERSEGSLVLFLDSDVSLDGRWLEQAVRFLSEDSTRGIVGGKLLYESPADRLNSYGGRLGRMGLAWDGHDGELESSHTEPCRCLWVSCSSMLARKDVLARIGGFDETFFYGFEEVDLGWRAKLAGYGVYCIPGARSYHRVSREVGRSDDRIIFHYCKNRLRMTLKNYGLSRLAVNLPLYLAYSVVDAVLRAPRRAKLEAMLWNLAAWPDTRRERARVQGLRELSDRKMDSLISRRLFPPTRLKGLRRRPVPEGRVDDGDAVRDDRVTPSGLDGGASR